MSVPDKNNSEKSLLPRVVVATVCFNAKNEISKTIESVLAQDYPNLDYIVVDGASRDGSREIIESYRSRLAHFVSEPDGGIYDAMNKAASLADGDDGWILFLNAGDTFFSSDCVSKIFSQAVPADVGLLYGDVAFPSPWGVVLKDCSPRDGEAEQLCHQCVFARLDLMKKIGFDTSYKVAADGRFFQALRDLGMKFEYRAVRVANYDAFFGVSSVRRVDVFEEYSRMNGLNPHSLYWKTRWARHWIRALISRIFPKRVDAFLRFLSIRSSPRTRVVKIREK